MPACDQPVALDNAPGELDPPLGARRAQGAELDRSLVLDQRAPLGTRFSIELISGAIQYKPDHIQ